MHPTDPQPGSPAYTLAKTVRELRKLAYTLQYTIGEALKMAKDNTDTAAKLYDEIYRRLIAISDECNRIADDLDHHFPESANFIPGPSERADIRRQMVHNLRLLSHTITEAIQQMAESAGNQTVIATDHTIETLNRLSPAAAAAEQIADALDGLTPPPDDQEDQQAA